MTAGPEPGDGVPGVAHFDDSAALLDALQRVLPLGHAVLDTAGRYVRVNEAMLAMNGGTREERLGRTITEVQPDFGTTVMELLDLVVGDGEARFRREITGETHAHPGEPQTWALTMYPVRDREGSIAEVGLIFEDVTASARAARHLDVVAKATASLLPAVTIDAVATVALQAVLPRTGATATGLSLAGEGGASDRAARPGAGTGAGVTWTDVADGTLHSQVLATGEAAWGVGGIQDPSVGGIQDPSVDARLDPEATAKACGEADNGQVWVGLPLATRHGVVGALILGFPPSSAPDRALLAAVADQCAIAVQRALFYERAEAAAGYARRLQAATARLAVAGSEDDVAATVLEELRASGATGGGLGAVDVRRRTHRYQWTYGWDHLEMTGIFGDRRLDTPSLTASALDLGTPLYVATPDELGAFMPLERAATVTRAGAREAWACLPLLGSAGAIGTIGLTFPDTHRFVEAERGFLESLAGQAALAIERVRRYQAEHQVAVVLQRALLPRRMPTVPGLATAVRYLAGAADAQVGGDWYDVFTLEDGTVALSVGDVAGHDLDAAGTMGRLRSQLHAYAHAGVDPAGSLDLLERLVHRADDPDQYLATMCFATWLPESTTVRIVSAGHPPPLVVEPHGARYAIVPAGPPLGAGIKPATYRSTSVDLDAAGATLVFFTDGLIERRGASIDAGLDRLRSAAVTCHQPDPNDLADHLLAAMRPPAGWVDDVALLVCRLRPAAQP